MLYGCVRLYTEYRLKHTDLKQVNSVDEGVAKLVIFCFVSIDDYSVVLKIFAKAMFNLPIGLPPATKSLSHQLVCPRCFSL